MHTKKDTQLLLRLVLVFPVLISIFLAKGPSINLAKAQNTPATSPIETAIQRPTPTPASTTTPTPSPSSSPAAATASNSNIEVLVTDDTATVKPGQTVIYRLVVRNDNAAAVSGINVTLVVPEFVIPSQVTPEGAQGSGAEREILWSGQSIPARSSQTFTVQGRVQNDAPDSTVLTARGTVSRPDSEITATDETTVEVDGATNSAPAENTQSEVTDAPVTAKTGPGTTAIYLAVAAAVVGAIGIRYATTNK